MLSRCLLIATLLLLSTASTGCVRGRLFTYVTEPLTENFQDTPVVPDRGDGEVIKLEYNNLQVQWNDNSIGHIATRVGFDEVYYADKRTLSILGFWTTTWVHVYGRRASE